MTKTERNSQCLNSRKLSSKYRQNRKWSSFKVCRFEMEWLIRHSSSNRVSNHEQEMIEFFLRSNIPQNAHNIWNFLPWIHDTHTYKTSEQAEQTIFCNLLGVKAKIASNPQEDHKIRRASLIFNERYEPEHTKWVIAFWCPSDV